MGIDPQNVVIIDSPDWLEIAQEFRPDVLWCHFDWEIGREQALSLKFLKAIATTSTGLTHIDTDYLKSLGIEIVHLTSTDKGLNEITATVDLTMALLTGLQTGLFKAFRTYPKAELSLSFTRDRQIRSSTIGLIGLGRIGFKVGEVLDSMGAEILFSEVDGERISSVSRSKKHWRLASTEEIFSSAHVVSLHATEQPNKEPIVTGRHFELAQDNLKLVNTARASLVDIEPLVTFLEASEKSAYAADFEHAYQTTNVPNLAERIGALEKQGCYVVSPHIGGASRDAAAKAEMIIIKKIKDTFLLASQG